MAGHLADYLDGEGRRLTVHNRTKEKAQKLLERSNVDWCSSKTCMQLKACPCYLLIAELGHAKILQRAAGCCWCTTRAFASSL